MASSADGADALRQSFQTRALAPTEVRLIEWLLAEARTRPDDVVCRWDEYQVSGGCECGCPSVSLSLTGHLEDEERHCVIAEASGASPEGAAVLVWLHAEGDALTELEIVPMGGTPITLPRPETLKAG
jgi:hypothetical protein